MPWGRSEQEYAGMFDLTSGDLSGNPLDCAAGLANFNAEVTAEGREAVSCDPLYSFTPTDILARIEATFNTMVENTRPARHEFVWREFGSPEHLVTLDFHVAAIGEM